ncbi:tonB-system energizer ExbB [Pontibaca methylaminivorans]|uniref:tonB-system energizer ExbB n=1 Tax=Pontibaca methylaminivorans TaxID=515897 RepID=UPI002FD9D263
MTGRPGPGPRAVALVLAGLLALAVPLHASPAGAQTVPPDQDSATETPEGATPAPERAAPAPETGEPPAAADEVAPEMAQDTSPSPSQTAPSGGEDASPAQSDPTGADTTDTPDTGTPDAPVTDATRFRATDAANDPAGDSAGGGPDTPATQAAEGTTAEAAPVPSPIEDPAGALSSLLSTPEQSGEMPDDLSPLGMYRNADVIVKLVMLGLIFASLVTWTVALFKALEIMGARTRAGKARRLVAKAQSLRDAAERMEGSRGPAGEMLRAALTEAELSSPATDHAGGSGLKERVTSALDQIVASAGRRAAIGTGILATIGSTAPFVWLFGTVWGIMNSFIGIAEAQSSSLAVVAPGIAEALLATALGLVAAIPAVIIYNACARWITGYRHELSEVAAGIERLVSRDLDFRQLATPHDLTARAAE